MKRLMVVFGLLAALSLAHANPTTATKNADSKVVGVTVYENTALVTREVTVPDGLGSLELIVSPLPPTTVSGSLYSEGSDGIRVLNTRYRTRATKEDTREEVRKLQTQLKDLQLAAQKIQSEIRTAEQNVAMLSKLENFTAATMQQMTEKGLLNGETTITLSKYIMATRDEKSRELVAHQQELLANQEQVQFTQRQLQELAAHSNKTERDAVIVVDKQNGGAGKVRLSYLVDSASWRPQYKFRAAKNEKDPVQVEYLAAVMQQSGEDWSGVDLVLSTAQPMLNAAPPDLKILEVSVVPISPGRPGAGGPGGGQQAGFAGQPAQQQLEQLEVQSKSKRSQAAQEFNRMNYGTGNTFINEAAAWEQTRDLLVRAEGKLDAQPRQPGMREGPSVTYHLPSRLTVPSRNDEQVIEVAKLQLTPDYFYKAVPVITPHVYRLANLENKSDHVLLPGEATMYIGTDFVGRTSLPLVAIGEQFTAGFGVDPQLQVNRQMVDKSKAMQGGNQVLKFEYRILISSYKNEPVKMQVWDRLPHAETTTVAVTLNSQKPELSKDPLYLREERTKNLLRWYLTVEPKMNGEKALAVNYDFKLELDRQMQIGALTAK